VNFVTINNVNYPAEKTARELGYLHPVMRAHLVMFIARYKVLTGYDLLVICTTRSFIDQAAAYKAGKSKAAPGLSWHQWGLAADLVPMVNGKPLWTTHDATGTMLPEWVMFGTTAAECGLEWAGNWKSFVEYDHVQFTAGLNIHDIIKDPTLLERIKS
jgi:peptidoglycan L-alanyl-D-glutamate endopeptidase CwlK